jgi:hypothetical protein
MRLSGLHVQLGLALTAVAAGAVDGRDVGEIRVADASGSLLTPDDRHLRHALDELHLLAGAAAVIAAVAVAVPRGTGDSQLPNET